MVVGTKGVVVSGAIVVHSTSSSGQSCMPLHQRVELMQILLVGHKIVPSGQGLQAQAQVPVTVLLKP